MPIVDGPNDGEISVEVSFFGSMGEVFREAVRAK
jgi:hypothetical protein